MIRPSIRTAALGLAATLVAGTVTLAAPANAAPDTTAPLLAGTVSFSPTTVDVTDGDAETTVSVQLTDETAVADATLTLVAPGGSPSDVTLERVAGTATNGTWTGIASFSSFDVTAKWTPTSLFVVDTLNNNATISGSTLGTSGVTVTRTADSVSPVLTGVTAATAAVDTTTGPADVVVRVRATDDLSGVESGTVTFTKGSDDPVEGTLSGDPVTGTSRDGSWDVTVTFPARTTPGVWRLSGITLADGQYNVVDYDSEDAELPSLAVRVTTTDDTLAPVLGSFSIGPEKVSTAYTRTVYAQVAFSDAVSGLATVEVTLQRPGGAIDYAESEVVAYADAEVRTGTSRTGTLTVPIYIDNPIVGAWKAYSVVLTDGAGNQVTVANAQLGARAGFTVSTAAADTTAPTTSGYAFSPDTLDTRTAAQPGTVLVAAADPDTVASGVARGEVTLAGPGTQTAIATFDATTDLASGDPANGTFRAGFTLPANAEDGAWRVTSIKITDAANRTSTTTTFPTTPTLTVLGAGRAPATAPGAPTIGTASIDGTTATVRWTAPYDNGGARITGYRLTAYRGGAAADTIDTTGTSVAVPNLVRGQSYAFVVSARNAAGDGPASAPSNAVDVPAAAPGAPVIGSATLDETTATVTWTAPPDNGGAAITGYVVTPFIGSARQPTVRVSVSGTATVADLARGRTYTFRVAATNKIDDGAQSQPSNPVSVAATVPAAPRVTATRVAGTSAIVAWVAPADGGAPISSYSVTGTPAGSCRTVATSCVVTGLTPERSYSFTVVAANGVGSGAASAPSPTVVAARPSPTTLTLAASPGKITHGATVTVTGRLTVAGSATVAAGQPVGLQYRSGTGGWTTWPTKATTATNGTVAVAGFRPTRSVQVRLVSSATDAYASSASAARTVAVSRVLTLGSRSVQVKRGKTMTLTGRATPVRPGGVLTLQRWAGGRWKAIASKRVNGSTYAFAVRSTKRGSYSYRVITAGDTAFAMSTSRTRTLRVR